jgi:hypothetical protein
VNANHRNAPRKTHACATVFPTAKTRGSKFARIDNSVLQNPSLSFRARGLLAYVLSMPKTWLHSAERFSAKSPDGESSIRSALLELRKAGYAKLAPVRDKNGTVRNRWEFRESPSLENRDAVQDAPSSVFRDSAPSGDLPRPVKPSPGSPNSGEPNSGEPGSGFPGLLETTEVETKLRETTEVETRGEKGPAPDFSPVQLDQDELADIARLKGIGHDQAQALLEMFNADRQRWFREDGQPTVAGFRVWLRKDKAACEQIDEFRRRATATRPGPAAATAEANGEGPAGWRDQARRSFADKAFAAGPWSAVPRDLQTHIARELRTRTPAAPPGPGPAPGPGAPAAGPSQAPSPGAPGPGPSAPNQGPGPGPCASNPTSEP